MMLPQCHAVVWESTHKDVPEETTTPAPAKLCLPDRVMSFVEMGGLFRKIVGTGTIRELRTPLSRVEDLNLENIGGTVTPGSEGETPDWQRRNPTLHHRHRN